MFLLFNQTGKIEITLVSQSAKDDNVPLHLPLAKILLTVEEYRHAFVRDEASRFVAPPVSMCRVANNYRKSSFPK